MDTTCHVEVDMQALEDRQREIEEQWKILLMERREFEARTQALLQKEKQFDLKWSMLIEETQRLASDKEAFERRKKFFDQVNRYEQRDMMYEQEDNIVHGEMFFSGVDNRIALKKRYRDLIKIYHPDGESGDNETIQEINREYEELKLQMQ